MHNFKSKTQNSSVCDLKAVDAIQARVQQIFLIKNPGKVKCPLKGHAEFQIPHVEQLSINEHVEGTTV